MRKKTVAGIDLGTNSCRLQIEDMDGNALYKNAISTRLGEGMGMHNRFTDDAVTRGIECFCSFKMLMDQFDVVRYRAIATAACRMAENGDEFVKKVKQHAGIDLEVIDGYEEAMLNLKGALLNVQDAKEDYVVIYDLGGGSTEISLATRNDDPEILHTVSIPWGARNASEKFGLREYNEKGAAKLAAEINRYCQKFIKDSQLEKYQGNICFIATSSTPLRLTHIVNGWNRYDREQADGVKILAKDIDKAIAFVHSCNFETKKQHPCIGPTRADIFDAACIIFSQIYKDLRAQELVASLKSAVNSIVMDLRQKENNHG